MEQSRQTGVVGYSSGKSFAGKTYCSIRELRKYFQHSTSESARSANYQLVCDIIEELFNRTSGLISSGCGVTSPLLHSIRLIICWFQNSIRHNLSLHSRFVRVINETTGKSSWWMVNHDMKPGLTSRRRAVSMDTKVFERKRGRVRKKVRPSFVRITYTLQVQVLQSIELRSGQIYCSRSVFHLPQMANPDRLFLPNRHSQPEDIN